MPYAVSLTGFVPSPRYDLTKWTQALISEGPDADGPFALIETIPVPDYPSPSAPPAQSVTTVMAAAASGLWYTVQFRDSNGTLGPISPAVYNVGPLSTVPTSVEIRAAWPQAQWAEWGYPTPAAGQLDGMDMLVDEAAAEFQSITGISVAADLDEPWPTMIRRAIRMLVGYNAGGMQPEVMDTVIDFDLISNFSVSSYSETRRGIGTGRGVHHAWPALNKLLDEIMEGINGSSFGIPAISFAPDCPQPGERQIYPYGRYWFGYGGLFARTVSWGAIPV